MQESQRILLKRWHARLKMMSGALQMLMLADTKQEWEQYRRKSAADLQLAAQILMTPEADELFIALQAERDEKLRQMDQSLVVGDMVYRMKPLDLSDAIADIQRVQQQHCLHVNMVRRVANSAKELEDYCPGCGFTKDVA